jgi:hypothetical protein
VRNSERVYRIQSSRLRANRDLRPPRRATKLALPRFRFLIKIVCRVQFLSHHNDLYPRSRPPACWCVRLSACSSSVLMEPPLFNRCQFLDDRSERESGVAVKPEFALARGFELGGWRVPGRLIPFCLLGRWLIMLGTNPVFATFLILTRSFLVTARRDVM